MIVENIHYTGVEISPEIAQQTAARYPKAQIINHEFLKYDFGRRRYNVVTAVGVSTLNLLGKSHQYELLEAIANKAVSLANRAVVFDFPLSELRESPHMDKDAWSYYSSPVVARIAREASPGTNYVLARSAVLPDFAHCAIYKGPF